MKKKVVLSLSIFVILISIIIIGNRPVHNLIEYDENTTLALFNEDGSKIDKVPSKDSGYTLDTEKSSCTNGSISWDDVSWSPVVTVNSEINGRVSCILYFKEITAYDKCIMEYGSDSAQCNILADLDEEVCPTVDENGNVLVSSAESENGYLCSAPDDYGTSYYYRGNVTNNYVKFGTNELGQDMYWRIIRINGDGSIRMIYDGTSTHANGESSADRQVGTSTFNPEHDDNAYAGYMYGTVGASTYEDTHANINDSTIKDYLDNWYKTNIEDKSLSSYISDTLFCNDRSLLQEEPFEYSNWNYNQLGYGLEATAYRWFGDPSYAQPGYDAILINYPRLTCSQQNDRFTVNDEILGNGNLTYPIGLITADEVYLAGATDMPNSGYYLYTGNMYWTMSPTGLEENVMSIRAVDMNGVSAWTNTDGDYAGNPFGVRPTINLKADSLKVGSGTANDPYRVA